MPTNTMPRSVLRHRPVTPDVQVQTPRASRVRQTPEPVTTTSVQVQSTRRMPWLVYLVLGMVCACLLLWIGQILLNWVNTTIDDVRYGRPRTTQVDHIVGHSVGNLPSHFIATNVRGQVYVVEISGGQPSQSHLLIGPRLIGPGVELAPVSLSFVGDPRAPDLIVEVSGVQMRFHNTGTSYTPESS